MLDEVRFGTVQEFHPKTQEQLAEQLRPYVSANGRFTPVTMMSEVGLNDPRVEGLEIYDTPGFNDPVVSRGNRTRKLLDACDVVFVFSTLTQFFGEPELMLLRDQLSLAGLSNKSVFLVGTQLDRAVRTLTKRQVQQIYAMAATKSPREQAVARVGAASYLIQDMMKGHVKNTLERHIRDIREKTPDTESRLLTLLEELKEAQLLLTCSWCENVGRHFDRISDEDRRQLRGLESVLDYEFDAEDLRDFSRIEQVREVILEQRNDKARRIEEKMTNLAMDKMQGVVGELGDLEDKAREDREKVATGEIADLKRQQELVVKRLEDGRVQVEQEFQQAIGQVKARLREIEQQASETVQQFKGGISVKREERQITRKKKRSGGGSFWGGLVGGLIGGLFGGIGGAVAGAALGAGAGSLGSDVVHETVVSKYALTQDAIEQVEAAVQELQRGLGEKLPAAIDIEKLRKRVHIASLGVFDTGSADFDADRLSRKVNDALRDVRVPEPPFGNKDYGQRIRRSFPSTRVDEGNIGALQRAQAEALTNVVTDLSHALTAYGQTVEKQLDEMSARYIDNLKGKVSNDSEKIQKMIGDRQASIQRFDEAIEALNHAKSALSKAN